MRSIWCTILLFPSVLAAQVKVDVPAGWAELEVPAKLAPEMIYLKKIASEDQSIQVVVAAMKPVAVVSAAEEFVAGQISGMKKSGFILESVKETEFKGFPAKHIRGEFRSKEYEGAYLVDTWVMFSDQATVSISVSIDDARGGRESAEEVFDWIEVSGSPAVLEDRPEGPSEAYRAGEIFGQFLFYAAVAAGLFAIVRSRKQKNKAKEAA